MSRRVPRGWTDRHTERHKRLNCHFLGVIAKSVEMDVMGNIVYNYGKLLQESDRIPEKQMFHTQNTVSALGLCTAC